MANQQILDMTAEGAQPQLSADGRWWWDGERWVAAVSEDGLWRWDGAGWQPVTHLDRSDPAALAESLDRLVDGRFAEGGHLLALRAHEWRPRDAELAELIARAAPLAARLAALDSQLATLESGGGLNLRQLLVGGEREQLEEEARRIDSELRPLTSVIGRTAPRPSLKEADEIVVPAHRLAARVIELNEAVGAERMLDAEHEERTAAARERLEAARRRREEAVGELEREVEARALEHERAIEDLRRALRTVRVPTAGAEMARFEGVTLYENRVDTPDGRGPLEGAEARLGTAAELWDSDRETVTRLGLLGAVHAARFHDALAEGGGQVFLLVVTPHARSLVPVPDGRRDDARAFAAAIAAAAADAPARRAAWQAEVESAEAALRAAMDDHGALDEARARLSGAGARGDLQAELEAAEGELRRVSTPTPARERARQRVEEIAEQLLQPPPPLEARTGPSERGAGPG